MLCVLILCVRTTAFWKFYLLTEFLPKFCCEEVSAEIFAYFRFDIWSGVWARAIRLISQYTSYQTTATSLFLFKILLRKNLISFNNKQKISNNYNEPTNKDKRREIVCVCTNRYTFINTSNIWTTTISMGKRRAWQRAYTNGCERLL